MLIRAAWETEMNMDARDEEIFKAVAFVCRDNICHVSLFGWEDKSAHKTTRDHLSKQCDSYEAATQEMLQTISILIGEGIVLVPSTSVSIGEWVVQAAPR
jgi:hypothetical protein